MIGCYGLRKYISQRYFASRWSNWLPREAVTAQVQPQHHALVVRINMGLVASPFDGECGGESGVAKAAGTGGFGHLADWLKMGLKAKTIEPCTRMPFTKPPSFYFLADKTQPPAWLKPCPNTTG